MNRAFLQSDTPLRCALGALLVLLGTTLTNAQETRASDEDGSGVSDQEIYTPPSLILTEAGDVLVGYLHALSEKSIVVQDNAGTLEEFSIAGFLATIATGGTGETIRGVGAAPVVRRIDLDRVRVQVESEQLGVVELVDGQRYPGLPASPEASSEESLRWNVRSGAESRFPLERVARVIFPWAGVHRGTLPTDASEDLVLLANGDELSGFVASIGDVIAIESGENIVEIEQERIAGIVLANPRERGEGVMLWLDDSTVARADTLATRSGRVLLESPLGVRIATDVASIRAYAPDAGRIRPLSTLVPTSQAPVGDRWRADPIEYRTHPDDLLAAQAPALGALDIFLPGPMSIDYEMPRDVQRFVTSVSLNSDAERWGDCHLVMTVAGEEIMRIHLHEQHADAAVNVSLEDVRPGATMTLTLEPGRYGPIRNQLTLHRPLLIVRD